MLGRRVSGAGERSRTFTGLRPTDFESAASAIPPLRRLLWDENLSEERVYRKTGGLSVAKGFSARAQRHRGYSFVDARNPRGRLKLPPLSCFRYGLWRPEGNRIICASLARHKLTLLESLRDCHLFFYDSLCEIKRFRPLRETKRSATMARVIPTFRENSLQSSRSTA